STATLHQYASGTGRDGCHTQIERLTHLVRRQPKGFRGSQGASHHANGDVIKATVAHTHRVTEATEHFVSQYSRGDDIPAIPMCHLCWRQDCSNGVTGMARLFARVAIVK